MLVPTIGNIMLQMAIRMNLIHSFPVIITGPVVEKSYEKDSISNGKIHLNADNTSPTEDLSEHPSSMNNLGVNMARTSAHLVMGSEDTGLVDETEIDFIRKNDSQFTKANIVRNSRILSSGTETEFSL